MLPQLSRPSVRLASLALARRPCLPSSLLARRFNSGEPASSVPVVEPTTSVPVRTRAEVAPIPPPKLDVGPARAPKEKQPQEYMMEAKWKFRKQAFSWWLLCMIPLSMLIKLTYDLEKLFTVWPEELRKPLRLALKVERNEDWPNAEIKWREAYNIARSPEVRPKLSLMHMTGLATSYVDLLITHALAPQRARPILLAALADIEAHPVPLTPPERQRKVAILSKLGEVAEKLKRDDEEEKYLTMALQDALKGVIEVRRAAKTKWEKKRNADGVEDLPTPSWVSQADIAICCENLANYYVKKGNGDYANTLYLHAINTILPPVMPGTEATAPEPSLDEVCRGAHLMTNLANSLLLHPSSENIRIAGIWATKAIQAANAGQDSPEMAKLRAMADKDLSAQEEDTRKSCDRVKAVALFNMGVLASMNREYDEARMFLTEAALQSSKVGWNAGRRKAEEARDKVTHAGKVEEGKRVLSLQHGKM